MKTKLFFLIIVLQLFSSATIVYAENADNNLVTQEILYVSPEASEVYLVWGINNWNLPDSSLMADGSYIKNNLVYTRMEKKKSGFNVALQLQPNTMIDYIFWITRGPAKKEVDVWDLNKPQKDYHTLAGNNAVTVKSNVKIRPIDIISILDFAKSIAGISVLILFLALFTINRMKVSFNITPVKVILGFSLMLITYLFFLRASAAGLAWDLYLYPFNSFSKVGLASFYDIIYVLLLSGSFILLLKLTESKSKARYYITGLFILICFSSLLGGIMNIRIIEVLGRPFNYAWFYYSDFLKSTDSQAAVSSNLTKEYVLNVFLIFLSALFSGMFFTVIADLISKKATIKIMTVTLAVTGSLIYLFISPGHIKKYNWDYDKLANPIVAFAASLNPFSNDPALFTMAVNDSFKFKAPVKRNHPIEKKKLAGIKNILVFVMESTPAEYVQPYSSSHQITPEIAKHLSESIVFENIYAHAPSTNNSMISILGSVYPYLSYNSITKEKPDINIPTLSSELKKHGYRTAFFNSADNRFQKVNEFLTHRKFDEIKDCNSLKCKKHFEVHIEKWDFQDGKDDECTAEELSQWIRQKPGESFFAMMWTYQTHYPYFTSGNEKSYDSDPIFNRYLNAVNHSDFVLGKILNDLKQNGLYESTLVVVVGDHGEAFGRHDQITHASGIYEENLHVPCIFINPAFKAERKEGIGGLVDIAPTIMNVLGYSYSEKWQGDDLFAKKENDRVYFFTPWADYLFGYREGTKKYIFNATKNLTEMYDLKNDPNEANNIALNFPDNTTICHQRIAGWVQYTNQYMYSLLGRKKNR
jgi:lipoteichoic acid synthase